ncbi:hypothetical protein QTP88_018152 [Uroleucon formosanum]
MDETQAINLITKHFPIEIQAYIQTTQEKKFLNAWEKFGELEIGYSRQTINDQQEKQYPVQRNQPPQRTNQTHSFNDSDKHNLTTNTPQQGGSTTSNMETHGQQTQINNNFKKTIKHITLTEPNNNDEEIEDVSFTEDTDPKNYEQKTVESD